MAKKLNLGEFYFTELSGTFSLYYSPECASTSGLALKALSLCKPGNPLLLYTFHQTAGRGQGENTWDSEPGRNLAFTLVLDITGKSNRLIALNKAITLGVHEAMMSLTGEETCIKWPNDILVNDKKISGLLLETSKEGRHQYLLAGIGINVNQNSWPGNYPATSLSSETGKEYVLIKVLHHVVQCIEQYLNKIDKNGMQEVSQDFSRVLWRKNQWVDMELETGMVLQGLILDVDDQGRIIFQDKDQKINKMHHGQIKITKNNQHIFKT